MNSRMPNRAAARSDVAPATRSSSSRSCSAGSPYCAGHHSLGLAIASCGNSAGARTISRDSPAASVTSFWRVIADVRSPPAWVVARPQGAAHRGARCVRREDPHRQLGPVVGRRVQLRDHLRVAQGDGAGGGETHGPVETHQLVRRHGVPVDEGDGEVARLRGGNEDGEGVRAGPRDAGDVDLVGAVGAGRLRGVGDLLPVEPGVEAEVDAVEPQPEGLAGGFRRHGELRPVPPGHGEGAVRGHLDVREVLPDGVGRPGNRPQVHPVVRVGVGAVRHQGRDDGGRHRRAVPARRREAGLRHRLAAGRHLRRGLDGPALAQLEPQVGPFERPRPAARPAKNAASAAVNEIVRTVAESRAGCMCLLADVGEATPRRDRSSIEPVIPRSLVAPDPGLVIPRSFVSPDPRHGEDASDSATALEWGRHDRVGARPRHDELRDRPVGRGDGPAAARRAA